jgi:hypothetical protein
VWRVDSCCECAVGEDGEHSFAALGFGRVMLHERRVSIERLLADLSLYRLRGEIVRDNVLLVGNHYDPSATELHSAWHEGDGLKYAIFIQSVRYSALVTLLIKASGA